MFKIHNASDEEIGYSEDTPFEFYRAMVNQIEDVEMRIVGNIGQIKALTTDQVEEAIKNPEAFHESFKRLPPAEVNTILMFKITGMIVNTGNWVLNEGVSCALQKLVFAMVRPDSKFVMIAIDPESISQVFLRSIPINPYPDGGKNAAVYSTIARPPVKGDFFLQLGGTRAWRDGSSISQFMQRNIVPIETPDEEQES